MCKQATGAAREGKSEESGMTRDGWRKGLTEVKDRSTLGAMDITAAVWFGCGKWAKDKCRIPPQEGAGSMKWTKVKDQLMSGELDTSCSAAFTKQTGEEGARCTKAAGRITRSLKVRLSLHKLECSRASENVRYTAAACLYRWHQTSNHMDL